MSTTSGTSDQVLSLPKGGGTVQGLGETFQPDFHTGTGSYAIPLDIPNGPNDIAPKLTLLYSSGAGNGPFGMGFGMNFLTIGRSTDKRVPIYRDDVDQLVLIGGGELVDLGGGAYRLRADTSGFRIARSGAGFTITDNDGKLYRLGVSEQAQLFVVEGGRRKVFRWLLEEIEDPLGNRAIFSYLRDANQLYLETVQYSIYTVRLTYDTIRPDPLLDARAGFMITTRLRCTDIELHTAGPASTLTRRWTLSYGQSNPGGHSLLQQVELTGFDENGQVESLPVLTLGYTAFEPRQLERFGGAVGDAPGALPGGRRELLDWDGDGLPDMIEIGGGRARVWPNLGGLTWGHPQSLPTLPLPVALDEPGVAFADMEGNGTADLVMLDRQLAGYYPLRPGGGFERPVLWRQAPSTRLDNPDARLVDLNGDGVIDLLVTGEHFFSLYYRDLDYGWTQRPSTVPRPQAPPVAFRDPRVRLADMNGDGLQDIVRVDGAGVTYWPYLGNERWADPVEMSHPPALPLRFEPRRLFLSDVDGDGCADLVYVDTTRVLYWLNQGGTRLGDQQEIAYTPSATPDGVRMADMKGNGTAGVLWSYVGPGSRTTDYFFLDFAGVKPYLLSRIDNGMGLITEIGYGVSTAEAARDRHAGVPWSTFLPFATPVVTALGMRDMPTGRATLSRYRYHDGHFDGASREFCGFGAVEIEDVGDEVAPTMLTRNVYHVGLDPLAPDRSLDAPERNRLRVLRGKLLQTEVFGLDGSAEQGWPYMRTESDWSYEVVDSIGEVEIIAPRLLESRSAYFERQATPYRLKITRHLAYDARGNLTDQEQRAEDPRDAALTRTLRTTTTFASDAAGRFSCKPARVVQRDGAGTALAITISYYDGLPEGQAGAQGLLTRQESLVLPDDLVTQVYGAASPDFAALGYHRRAGEDGWWVDQMTYTRTDDAFGLRGTIVNAKGSATQIFYEQHRIHPVRLVDALDNTLQAEFDYRANKLRTLTDANGAVIVNQYDPLGRLVLTVEPGATKAFPSALHAYHAEQIPVRIDTDQRAVDGQAGMMSRTVFLDGAGQVIEERVASELGEVIERSLAYSSRGMVKAHYLPRLAPGAGYAAPDDGLPHHAFRYDALGRLVEIQNADGTLKKQRFEPGVAFLFDEEDLRADAAATHRDTPTRNTYDPTGRVLEVALNDGGRLLVTRYEYDVKGHLLAVEEADGQRSAFVYDLLGHRLRTINPSSGTTLFVFDANGAMVRKQDARSEVVDYVYDQLDRLKRVSFPATGEVSAEYIYHDTAPPTPPEASTFTKGRLVKVIHQGGQETYDYDPRGRLTRKSMSGPGMPAGGLRLDFTYRSDGQRSTVTYPEGEPAAGRRQIRYEYNQRGLLLRIPDAIRRIDYNPAGLRTRVEYANDVVTTYEYQPLTFRLQDLVTRDGAGATLQEYRYAYDQVANLVSVTSPDPKAAMTYEYDDLYRLIGAARGASDTWTYTYDDLGNLTSKSDIGLYSYDAHRRLSAAGADTFTYTAAGQMLDAPWGRSGYDAMGYLRTITKGAEQMSCTYNHDGQRVRAAVSGAAPRDLLTPDDLVTIEDGIAFAYILDSAVRVAQLRLDSGAVSWLHGDHLGSTTLVTGPAGQQLQRVYYDPFGAILEQVIAPGVDGTRYLYTGAVLDTWSGLSYLHARYYHAEFGRFTTPDTLVPELHQPQAWNRYSYVQNNPLRFIDPTGHFWEEIGDWFKNNWKYIVAAIVIIAVVVLTIVTFGVGALVGVGIAMAIGGVVGGIAAAQAGGDILLGVLVGMAVGGVAGFASAGIGAGVAAIAGKGLVATLVSGTLSGAVSGAAMGFAAGFAGGAGTAETIFDRMWKGALVGAIMGFAFSFVSYGFQHNWFSEPRVSLHKPSSAELGDAATRAITQTAKDFGQQGNAGTLTGGSAASTAATNFGKEALSTVVKVGTESGYPIFTGAVTSQVWQAVLTSGTSGIFVLDWADDLWRFAVGKGLVKAEKSGTF